MVCFTNSILQAETLISTANLAMTKLEEDGDFELQTKRWTELIELRKGVTGHNMDPTGVDIAIANVFDPKKGHIIDGIIVDGRDLIAMILQLEELHIDSTNVKMTLAKAFVPGASTSYAADLVKLKGMMKMRERMSEMGIPTGCIEATIADVFKVSCVESNGGKKTLLTIFSQCRFPQRWSSPKKRLRLPLSCNFHQRERPSSSRS